MCSMHTQLELKSCVKINQKELNEKKISFKGNAILPFQCVFQLKSESSFKPNKKRLCKVMKYGHTSGNLWQIINICYYFVEKLCNCCQIHSTPIDDWLTVLIDRKRIPAYYLMFKKSVKVTSVFTCLPVIDGESN